MAVTCRNCGQTKVGPPRVHEEHHRSISKRDFGTPGCTAPCDDYQSLSKSCHYQNVPKLTGETSGEAEVASVETTLAGPHRPVIGQCCAIQKNSGKGEG